MPKIIIPKESFGEMDIYTQKYNVRYRIASENQNSFSYWSPIFEVDPELIFWPGTVESFGYLYVEKLGSGFVTLTWTPVSIYKYVNDKLAKIGKLQEYDVWIQWAQNGEANPSNWIYEERTSNTSLQISIPDSYIDAGGITRTGIKEIYVQIYRPGRPIVRYEQTYSFPQNSTTVDIVNNVIDFGRGHGSATGTEGKYISSNPIGGLISGTKYYTRTINYTTIALYTNMQAAIDADDNYRVDFSSTGSGTGSFTGLPFMMYQGSEINL